MFSTFLNFSFYGAISAKHSIKSANSNIDWGCLNAIFKDKNDKDKRIWVFSAVPSEDNNETSVRSTLSIPKFFPLWGIIITKPAVKILLGGFLKPSVFL